MEWWSMTPTEVLKKLRTEERTGLSENEAQKRLETDGRNRTEQGEGKKGFQRRFLAQFNDFMILLLIGAAVASVAISYWNGEGFSGCGNHSGDCGTECVSGRFAGEQSGKRHWRH